MHSDVNRVMDSWVPKNYPVQGNSISKPTDYRQQVCREYKLSPHGLPFLVTPPNSSHWWSHLSGCASLVTVCLLLKGKTKLYLLAQLA